MCLLLKIKKYKTNIKGLTRGHIYIYVKMETRHKYLIRYLYQVSVVFGIVRAFTYTYTHTYTRTTEDPDVPK